MLDTNNSRLQLCLKKRSFGYQVQRNTFLHLFKKALSNVKGIKEANLGDFTSINGTKYGKIKKAGGLPAFNLEEWNPSTLHIYFVRYVPCTSSIHPNSGVWLLKRFLSLKNAVRFYRLPSS